MANDTNPLSKAFYTQFAPDKSEDQRFHALLPLKSTSVAWLSKATVA
jgi:hypothetical protein